MGTLKQYKTFLLSLFLLVFLGFAGYLGFNNYIEPIYQQNYRLQRQNDSLLIISYKKDSIQTKIIRDTVIKTVYKREIQKRIEYINRKDVKYEEIREAFKKLSYE
jgi:hypothetical protein